MEGPSGDSPRQIRELAAQIRDLLGMSVLGALAEPGFSLILEDAPEGAM